MDDLMRYAASLEDVDWGALPPVETWNPARAGDVDIIIKSDGTWVHEGAPIRRARLVKLFSTILKREDDEYFLVTPVEKLKITVEDAPFIAVRMDQEGESARSRLNFVTNMGEAVIACADHLLAMRAAPGGELAPYIEVRRGLEARIGRAVYYDLVALGERRQMEGVEQFGVWSMGVFFPLARADELDA